MDAASMQLVAERMGLSAEDMAAIQSGDISQILSRRLADGTVDPLEALVMTTLMQGRPAEDAGEDAEAEPVEGLIEAEATIDALRQHLADADAMIGRLATALGACPVCWGSSERCPRCHGNGRPGSRQPDREELIAWVTPALRRLGLRVVAMES
jgi:hypothetical protein